MCFNFALGPKYYIADPAWIHDQLSVNWIHYSYNNMI